MNKNSLIDFIIYFMEEIDKEISELKLALNSRFRTLSGEFMKEVSRLLFFIIYEILFLIFSCNPMQF